MYWYLDIKIIDSDWWVQRIRFEFDSMSRISTYLSLDITEAPTYWSLLVSMGYKFGHENDFKRRWYGIGRLGMVQKSRERANVESRRERRLLSFEDTKVGEWRLLKYLLLYYQDKRTYSFFFSFSTFFLLITVKRPRVKQKPR